MDTLTLEEALRVITEKAAVMRFLSDSGSYADYQAPDSAVLRGLGAMCSDIEELTQRVKRALTGPVLETPLPSLSTPVAAAHPRVRDRARAVAETTAGEPFAVLQHPQFATRVALVCELGIDPLRALGGGPERFSRSRLGRYNLRSVPCVDTVAAHGRDITTAR